MAARAVGVCLCGARVELSVWLVRYESRCEECAAFKARALRIAEEADLAAGRPERTREGPAALMEEVKREFRHVLRTRRVGVSPEEGDPNT